ARRAQCINNLKQIGLAIANYESTNSCYPICTPHYAESRAPAIGMDASGMSWMVGILPYVEQTNLMNAMNYNGNADPGLGLNQGVISPANRTYIRQRVSVYFCPSDGKSDVEQLQVWGYFGVPFAGTN